MRRAGSFLEDGVGGRGRREECFPGCLTALVRSIGRSTPSLNAETPETGKLQRGGRHGEGQEDGANRPDACVPRGSVAEQAEIAEQEIPDAVRIVPETF